MDAKEVPACAVEEHSRSLVERQPDVRTLVHIGEELPVDPRDECCDVPATPNETKRHCAAFGNQPYRADEVTLVCHALSGCQTFLRGLRRRPFWNHSRQTIASASQTILRDILELPWNRSVKMIGTSATRSPCRQILCVISIWKL